MTFVTVRLQDPEWREVFESSQTVFMSTLGIAFPKSYVSTTWGDLRECIEDALREDDLNAGPEAASIEGDFMHYFNSPFDGRETNLWVNYVTLRFLSDGEIDLYYLV